MCAYNFSLFLETDRFKCGVCAVSNMVIDIYNIKFEMNNKGGAQ
jgi:hypothetical protein